MEKIKLLYLCTGNSCRSQMAEGWTHELKSDEIKVYSAGIETHGLNPNAVKVMAEAGVDITGQKGRYTGRCFFDRRKYNFIHITGRVFIPVISVSGKLNPNTRLTIRNGERPGT